MPNVFTLDKTACVCVCVLFLFSVFFSFFDHICSPVACISCDIVYSIKKKKTKREKKGKNLIAITLNPIASKIAFNVRVK